MKDHEKTIEQLVKELTELRSQNATLEKTRKELAVIKIVADEVSEFAENVINTVREPLIALDQDLRVVKVSSSFYDFFKVSPEETVGQLIYDLGNKQWDIPKLRELLEIILPEKATFDNYEVEHDFATIGRRTMLLNARQIQRGLGKERIILLAIEDITEHKRLEDLLKEAEGRYRHVFETASDGIVLFEKREGKITHANQAVEKMLGYSLEECIEKKLQDIGIVDIDDFQTIMQILDEIGINHYTDVPIKTKSGQYIDTDIYLADRAKLVQCNIRDISQRKLAEESLKEKNEEIRDMTQQLWQAAKLATMGELSASIAHELNNPLATVSLRVESLLGKTPEDNSNHRELEIIEQEVDRMGNLVANLLNLSRRGQQQISTVDVREEIEKTLELIYYHLRKHNIIIGRAFGKEIPCIQADCQQLRQLFLNLFTNASDAMPQGGKLTIRVIAPPESKQLVIEVTDTGMGIPPEVLPKVMEPFFTTKQEGRGTGLGLAICRRIVQGHKGTFDLTSEGILGRGTTARISLPVTSGNNAAGLKDKDQ